MQINIASAVVNTAAHLHMCKMIWTMSNEFIEIVYFSESEASPGSDGEGLAERSSCSFSSPSDLTSATCDPPTLSSMDEIQVELQCADLWKRFHDIGTEMIITKAGR